MKRFGFQTISCAIPKAAPEDEAQTSGRSAHSKGAKFCVVL